MEESTPARWFLNKYNEIEKSHLLRINRHGVGHSPYYHHHAPIYIKQSTVNAYKIDSG